MRTLFTRMTRGLSLAVLGVALSAGVALGNAKVQEQLTQYTVKAQEFDAQDKDNLVVKERGTLRAWLNEAQGHLAKDDIDECKLALDRVKEQTKLIGALLTQAERLNTARVTHDKAANLEQSLLKTKNEALRLEARKAELEQQGF
ncbi:MAG: hypothetical protein ACE366_06095 [Bradymonadia bacterium]